MFPKFPSVLRVIERSDQNPPITATGVTFTPSLRHASGWEHWNVSQMLIYTSHLSQGKRFVFIHKFVNGESMENAKKSRHKGSFGFSEYLQGKQKNYTEGRTGESHLRVDFGEWCVKWGWPQPTWLLRFVTFAHLPFSVGSLNLFVASRVFMKGTSYCVIRRNLIFVASLVFIKGTSYCVLRRNLK